MHEEGPGSGGDPAAVGEEPLERVDQAGVAPSVVLDQLLHRLPVAVARRLVELEVHQVAVGTELLVGDSAALGHERAADSGRVGGLANPPPGACSAAVDVAQVRPPVPPRGPAARRRPAAARPRHPCPSASGASARTRSGRESRNAREPSRRSCSRNRAASSDQTRALHGCSRRPLDVHEEVRLAQVAARLTRLRLRSLHRAGRERVEHVLDEVLGGQALDQLGLLQPNGGLVGDGAEQLLVLLGELPVVGEAADDPELFVAGHQRGDQQRVLVDVRPEGSRRPAAPATPAAVCPAHQVEHQAGPPGRGLGSRRSLSGSEPASTSWSAWASRR